jgi:ribose/xylose/arabinose/galactoside ABC-type transport system permease subunit
MKSPISQFLITIGVVLVLAGLLWPVLNKTGLGHLPGDIVVERENFRFYVPITSSIIVSLILTILFWLFRR